ncbi:hypothetical protein JYQ62_04655 [Nostoc sp. UHCC 0702]|nr:hypothetical protein JYQ62_04655 [Nostoc sp. UHCC 0702]
MPDSNSDKSKIIIPISSEVSTTEDTTKLPEARDSAISDSRETILSESTSDTSLVTTKSNLRIPISSRIFAVPSMQQ